MEKTQNASPGLNCLLSTSSAPSIDRVLERVEKAGGSVLTTKTALPPGMGFYAHIGDTDGIRVASIIDPFGNLVGLIENPHFKAGHGG